MSRRPLSPSPDLLKLREEGYLVERREGLLALHEVPYVNAQRQVKRGTLISSLNMAGDVTTLPDTHVVYFDGDYPCNADGTPIEQIRHQTQHFALGHGLTAQHSFSSKPQGGYRDYHHKMSTYATLLAGPATTLDPNVTPRVFKTPEEEDSSVFHYAETASGRVGIGALTEKLEPDVISIIGLGGTGGYILDQVAKTPVREIRLFDKDTFLQHNAFRAPGAPSLEELREAPFKVHYFASIYSKMRRFIVPYPVALDASNIALLDGTTFAFLSMDAGDAKRAVVAKLEAMNIPFIDVGMGLELVDGSLGGILRVTASTPTKRDHIHSGRISFAAAGPEDIYSSNIQVADLNALNAILAIIKWKKIRRFYRDLERELHCTYTTDGNLLISGDNE